MLMSQSSFLFVSASLFLIGVCGIMLNSKNIILMLMSVELMLLAIDFNFIVFSVFLDDMVGQVFALFMLTVAAAESAIGLAILVIYYSISGTVSMEYINLLKG